MRSKGEETGAQVCSAKHTVLQTGFTTFALIIQMVIEVICQCAIDILDHWRQFAAVYAGIASRRDGRITASKYL